MTIARFSRLPVLQFCGKSHELGESGLSAGSRASALGTAFHAKCSESAEYNGLRARLTSDEQAALDALIRPTPILVGDVELLYDEAHKEVKCALRDADGAIACAGTADLYWVYEGVLYCADIKKTKYTAADGPDSLQVVGYATALCMALGCDGYHAGIWDATDGEWSWGPYVDSYSARFQETYDTLVAAAKNLAGEYNVGPHCMQCYSRWKCPQFLLPLDMVGTSLEPFTAPGVLTHETAAAALIMAARAEETAEEVKRLVKSFAQSNGGEVRDDSTGKVWRGVSCKGRATLDRASLEKENPELVQRHTRFGAAYYQYRWVNGPNMPKKGKKS